MKKLFTVVLFALVSHSTVLAATFVYCSEGSPSAFNPQVTSDGTSNNAAAHTIFERLVDFEPGTTNIIPALAKSWTVSQDKLTYTFKLRDDVHFHKTRYFSPTRKLNADDVVFSFMRMHDAAHPFHKVSGGKYEYYYSMGMEKLIKEIKKIDSHTVAIKLSRPNAPFIANMAMSFMSIHSQEYGMSLVASGNKKQMDQKPIGTGPYIYKKYVKDTLIRYKKNKEYWGPKAKIKKLVFAITPDSSVRVQKLRAGECHLIASPPPAEISLLEKDANIKVISQAGMNVGYLAMNTMKKPLDNLKVRQAINFALNKQAYIKAIYLNNAQKAINPLPPMIWSYNKKVKDLNYNPKKAKQLLKEAGFGKGLTLELWTLPVARPYNPNGKKMGELMQADLAKVGITVKLISYDWPTYLEKSSQGQHQLLQMGWNGDNGDPDNFLHTLLSCQSVAAGANYAKWCFKPFDKLVEKAREVSSQKKRSKLYLKAQTIFKQQVPWVTIAHAKEFRAMRKQVQGFIMDPLGGDILRYVSLQ